MKVFKDYWIFLIFIILSLIVLAVVFCKNAFLFEFTKNTGLYLYSTLIQSNAAIISLFGVFYIFRLQTLKSAISEIYESMCNLSTSGGIAARQFRHFSLEDKWNKIDSYSGATDLRKEYEIWYEYELLLNNLKSMIFKPSVIIITLISFQIVFLIFSNNIHTLGIVYELICFILITLFQIYVLILLGKTIFRMVE